VDPLDEARHPEVPDGVVEPVAADVASQLLGVFLHPCPPVVLDLVVGAARQVRGDLGPAVAPARVEVEDEQLLPRGEVPAAHPGAEVVEPAEAAALARAPEPRGARQLVPPPFAVRRHVPRQQRVLVHRPRPPPQQLRLRRRPVTQRRRTLLPQRVHLDRSVDRRRRKREWSERVS